MNELRILLVEDDNATRAALCEMIRQAPHFQLAGEAADYSAASVMLEQLSYDLVLLDLDLHGVSAVDLIRRAKLKSSANVLIISVLGDEHNVLTAIRNGADGYLIKDTSADTIRKAIDDIQSGQPPLSPAVARYLLRNLQPQCDSDAHVKLAPRELQMLENLAAGHTYQEIADRYDLSYHTVVDYVRSLYRKLEVTSRGEALITGVKRGLISIA